MLNVHPMVRSKSPSRFARINTISECEQREEQLRFIAHELGHRTKNLLAVVQAIANQTAQRSASLRDFQSVFSQRLQGLSRSIDLLMDEDGRNASIADLVRSQLEPFGEVDGVRIAATGPTVFLNHEATRSIGLALHELATNASKHGALSVPKGVVTVNWEIRPSETGPRFRLIWREHNGPEVMPPKRLGFGHVVLQRTTGKALQGKATHEFGAGGVSWTIEAPATAVVMQAQSELEIVVREVRDVSVVRGHVSVWRRHLCGLRERGVARQNHETGRNAEVHLVVPLPERHARTLSA